MQIFRARIHTENFAIHGKSFVGQSRTQTSWKIPVLLHVKGADIKLCSFCLINVLWALLLLLWTESVNNSTNINNTNIITSNFKPLNKRDWERERERERERTTTTYGVVNPCSGLEQAQKRGGLYRLMAPRCSYMAYIHLCIRFNFQRSSEDIKTHSFINIVSIEG